ncbi:MAG TPA: mandelate racemase/muconate lactonizing enzyme family protein [Steroidobacteraceae bacterium]|jgi:L-alanine-DL-glutamate epimerase-like enolase superfamily enzyme|nr:mandelate racemase/muconate lactonizing enzyme family protein [Steroidobacteraceae bacterium]
MSTIEAIETVRYQAQPNILWVRVHADNGMVGLGETFYLPGAVEAVVHDMIADFSLGQPVFNTEHLWDTVFSWANFYGYAGAEMRAMSAFDIALWDLKGQLTGRPIYDLLGGECRADIPVYNTCVDAGQYRDQHAFLHDPGGLARSLLAEGITALKMWPWDRYAPKFRTGTHTGPAGWLSTGHSGPYLSERDLQGGLECVKRIRDAVGDEMEIMIEGHSRWDLNNAIRIGRALEPYRVMWMEDMIKPDSAQDLKRLSQETRVPHSISERLMTRYAFREVLECGAAHVVMPDLIWTGGLTEGKKIAIMADAYHLSIAPHDCTGLVALYSNLHLCAASMNAMILECVRGFYRDGWYGDVYTHNIDIEAGRAKVPRRPGLGTALKGELLASSQVRTRISRKE